MPLKLALVIGPILAALCQVLAPARGDQLPFTVELKEVTFPDAPALQSFALAQDFEGPLALPRRPHGRHARAKESELLGAARQLHGL